jgi:hypothetical protein
VRNGRIIARLRISPPRRFLDTVACLAVTEERPIAPISSILWFRNTDGGGRARSASFCDGLAIKVQGLHIRQISNSVNIPLRAS